MDARLIKLLTDNHWKHVVRLVSDLEYATVALIDCDQPGVADALKQLGPNSQISIVCYAFYPKDHATSFPDCIILGKPLDLETLPNILVKAAEVANRHIQAQPTACSPMSTQSGPLSILSPPSTEVGSPSSLGNGLQADDAPDLCGNMDDLPDTPTYPVPEKLFFNPNIYLIGHIQRAVAQATSSGWPYLIAGLPRLIGVRVQPTPACMTEFREGQLRSLSIALLPHTTIRSLDAPTFDHVISGATMLSTEDFLWNVAGWAARGRLPEGHDPYKPVTMRAWPNFTQVALSPYALRIVATWVGTWASPIEVAARLGIPQRYVFSIFSSAHFAGLLEENMQKPLKLAALKTAPPNLVTQDLSPEQQRRPSILSRILRKLINAF